MVNVKYYINFSYNRFKINYINVTKTPINHFFSQKIVEIFFLSKIVILLCIKNHKHK